MSCLPVSQLSFRLVDSDAFFLAEMISLSFSTLLPHPSPPLNLLSSRKFKLDGVLSLVLVTPTPVLTRLGPLFLRLEVSRFSNSAVHRTAEAPSLLPNVPRLASSTLPHKSSDNCTSIFVALLSRLGTNLFPS